MKKGVLITAAVVAFLLLFRSGKAFGAVVKNQTIRGCDPLGCGHFGASRGGRLHEGVDIDANPGEVISSPISGTVTRFPIPYASDSRYTGIEIKNNDYWVKIFYVKPSVGIGSVAIGQAIGYAQDLTKKYGSTITNHVHVEVRKANTDTLIDPSTLF